MLERLSGRHSLANLRCFLFVDEKERAGRLHLDGAWFDILTATLWISDGGEWRLYD